MECANLHTFTQEVMSLTLLLCYVFQTTFPFLLLTPRICNISTFSPSAANSSGLLLKIHEMLEKIIHYNTYELHFLSLKCEHYHSHNSLTGLICVFK